MTVNADTVKSRFDTPARATESTCTRLWALSKYLGHWTQDLQTQCWQSVLAHTHVHVSCVTYVNGS